MAHLTMVAELSPPAQVVGAALQTCVFALPDLDRDELLEVATLAASDLVLLIAAQENYEDVLRDLTQISTLCQTSMVQIERARDS